MSRGKDESLPVPLTASNSYATFFYARIDAAGRRMRYANAGHHPPYVVRRTAGGVEITQLCTGGMVLGLFPETEYEEGGIDLQPGDLFVAFTDGVTEAHNAADEEFGEERLEGLLHEAAGDGAEEVSARLAAGVRAWIAGAEQYDDLTIVVARIN